jgi:serine/threonine-protein kinase HipA
MVSALDVWMNGRHVGVWRKIRGDRNQFVYDKAWLEDRQFRPLSLSLPVTASREITSPLVRNYFDNLLPDDAQVRERIRSRYRLRSAEPFDLLGAVGRDCVGAVQLMPTGQAPVGWDRIESRLLKAQDVATILRAIPTTAGPLGAQSEDDEGFRISISGAQEKTALLRIGSTWHRPFGATPTTHILKLPLGMVGGGLQLDLSDSVDNEWLCAALFEALQLPVARTQIATFGDQRVLVVERFDRSWRNVGARDPNAARFKAPPDAWIARLPQEDFCQSTGRPSHAKYEKDGGPGMTQILGILARGETPERDSSLFALSQMMFWLLAATDGHAKNFSIFLRRGGHGLTPFYDLLSAWPVIGKKARQLQPQKVKMAMAMAMRTGNRPHYRWSEIQPRHFKTLAQSLPDPNLWSKMLDIAGAAPHAIASVRKRAPPDLKESVWSSVTDGFAKKAEEFLRGAQKLVG